MQALVFKRVVKGDVPTCQLGTTLGHEGVGIVEAIGPAVSGFVPGDGTQAEYVRIPRADFSLHHIPEGADEEALTMLSDILPTGFECGVLNGKVEPGCSVVIVGAGPIGLAALTDALTVLCGAKPAWKPARF